MTASRFRLTERQALMILMGLSLFGYAGAILWNYLLSKPAQALTPTGSPRIRWMRSSSHDFRSLYAEYFDPSLMSLPSPHGFSQAVWSRQAPSRQHDYEPPRVPAYLTELPPVGVPVLLETPSLAGAVLAGIERTVPIENELPVLEMVAAATNSVLRATGALAARGIVRQPTLPLSLAGNSVRGTRVTVAVNPDGRVQYAALERSCGNEALDGQALDLVRQVRFEPVSSADPLAVMWGVVRFVWATGN